MVRLGHVHLPVPELARSVAFYRDQLGLEVEFTSDSMAEFPAAGLVLDQEGRFTRSPAPVTVGLAVDDVDSLFAELAGRGVPVTEPPRDRSWGVRNFYVTDPRAQGVVATLLVDDSFRGHHIRWPPWSGCRALAGAGPWPGPWLPAAQGPQRSPGSGPARRAVAQRCAAALRPEGRPRMLRGTPSGSQRRVSAASVVAWCAGLVRLRRRPGSHPAPARGSSIRGSYGAGSSAGQRPRPGARGCARTG